MIATPFAETVLDSGVRVVTERMPEVRSVAIGFWIRVGSRDEQGADAGASHFLEHLLFKGTARRSAREIAEALDAVGGDMNAFTSKEYTCYHARVLDRDVPIAVDVLADMVGSATIAEADVEQERAVVLEEIAVHLDSPDDLVHSDLTELLLDDHPLAREVLGTVASISAMDRDRVHGYYAHHYRPANLTVAAAGNLDHDAFVSIVAEVAGDLGRPGGDRPTRTPPSSYRKGAVTVRNRPTEQVHLAIGGPGLTRDDERRYAFMVATTLLGGGMSSRLFQEIREQRGLAYSTYAYHHSYADGGLYAAYAGTSPAKADEVLKVVRDELDRLPSTLTVEEVERAKGTLKGGLVLGLEDTGSRMSRLGKMVCTEAELVSVDEALARIGEVDLAAVRAIAEQVIGGQRVLAVVGPFDADDGDRFEPYVS